MVAQSWRLYVMAAALAVGQWGCSQRIAALHPSQAPSELRSSLLDTPLTVTAPAVRIEAVQRVRNTLLSLQRFNNAGRNRELQQVYFELPEYVLNEYLSYSLETVPRPGIEQVRVKLKGRDHASISVVFNLDRIGDWAPILPNLLRPILGKVRQLDFDILFEVRDSRVTFHFADSDGQEDAATNALLQTLIHVVMMHQPERYDTSQPIPLPFGLQRLWTTDSVLGGQT
jgi:hypothetical protein